MAVPKRVAERIQTSLKAFNPILQAQRARDVSEADTVTVVKDLLGDAFGYDKYAEVTGEHSIRGTFCDLAIKIDGKLALLIEVKAIGMELKDSHIKQAVDYASNQGCEWVILTNATEWRLYHVIFKKPIDKQEVARIDLLSANARNENDLECLYIISREGFTKNAVAEYRDRKDATSRFMIAAILLRSEAIQKAIRREIRRVSNILVEPAAIDKILREEVIKRETIEGDQALAAARRVGKAAERTPRRDSAAVAPTVQVPPEVLAAKSGGSSSAIFPAT
jgi:hypothetical protein